MAGLPKVDPDEKKRVSIASRLAKAETDWVDEDGLKQAVAQVMERGVGLPTLVQVNAADGSYTVVAAKEVGEAKIPALKTALSAAREVVLDERGKADVEPRKGPTEVTDASDQLR
jgi:D-alanine-D-alanine ligase-like ATP-grasp enzyme